MKAYTEEAYLIGQISAGVPATYLWREHIREYFKHRDTMSLIDPCENAFNQSILKDAKLADDPGRFEVYRKFGTDLLVPKDKTYVKQSTMGIANMYHWDTKKPMIGTIFELAWYHDFPEKSVIGIFPGDWKKDIHCNHPFVRSVVDTWVKNEQEACKLIEFFYL